MLFAILFLICYMFLMFIKATNNKAYESLFNFTSMNIPHVWVFFACVASSILMISKVIYNFPLETICLLVVIVSHYAFKSKTLIKSKIKSFLKNMLED
jgi:hypothetical protein